MRGDWSGAGTDNISINPQFCRLPDDGGDGWGSGDNDDFGNLRLKYFSPCIDAGDNLAVSPDTLDLDGDGDRTEACPFDKDLQDRFMDAPEKADDGNETSPVVDMGAYEARPFVHPPVDVRVEVADGHGGIDEQSFTLTQSSCQLSDLTISAVDSANLTTDLQTLQTTGIITAEVTNAGSEDISTPFEVVFFEDLNFNGLYDQETDNILASTMVSAPLPAGTRRSVAVDADCSLLFPGSFVYGCVDSANSIDETDEDNNIARSSMECSIIIGPNQTDSIDAPNLIPCHVRHFIKDNDITYTLRIGNSGESTAPAGVKVSVYDGDPATGGICLGTVATSSRLAPGRFEDVPIVLPLTDMDSIRVSVDDDGAGNGQVSECNEEDNLYHPDFKVDLKNG